MALAEELIAVERELAGGDGDTYRRLLAENAQVIVPGMRLDKERCASAIDESPGWDAFTLEEPLATQLDSATALLTYRFDGARGVERYSALMASVYVEHDGGWLLAFHQQTPLA